MGIVTRGFRRRQTPDDRLPPGQYLIGDFPVLSAGPTPRVPPDAWASPIRDENDDVQEWSWQDLTELPIEEPTVNIHCVTWLEQAAALPHRGFTSASWPGLPAPFLADQHRLRRIAGG